ncbi:class I SAM-dependent methyltransferase [Patescibacteria group bacterium]|nr:class I SAM-dependent methyltransferase [Patescibacteria group bacterium]
MPLREGGYQPMERLPAEQRRAIDKEYQAHWYRYVAGLHASYLHAGTSVLDVGAGTGYGLRILREAGINVHGFDVARIDPSVPVDRIERYATESYGLVLALDVIEHVEYDHKFLDELLRVAYRGVFISTPNWNVSRAENQYHVREYTPTELRDLLASRGFVKPLGAKWNDAENDHRIYVSNHLLKITTREEFDPNESWHNQAVLLEKDRSS